jgi:GT2 family glycosyltransferase
MTDTVAIVLVNWNSFSLTADCIRSLHEMTAGSYDIIVVDNGSADGSGKQLKAAFNDIILIESDSNLGFTGGNNLGMQYALDHGYTYVFLLNNDTFVQKDLLEKLVGFMQATPDAGAVQPIIYYNHDRSVLWNGGSGYNNWLGLPYTSGVGKKPGPVHLRTRKVDWVTGCAFFIRAEILKQTGMFAENLFIYCEDVDLSFRISKNGYGLYYHPASAVYHIAGMANKAKVKGPEGFVNAIVHYLNVRNRIWLLKEYTKPWYLPTVVLFNLFYTLALIAYFAIRRYPKKLTTVLKAVRDGLKGRIIYK